MNQFHNSFIKPYDNQIRTSSDSQTILWKIDINNPCSFSIENNLCYGLYLTHPDLNFFLTKRFLERQ